MKKYWYVIISSIVLAPFTQVHAQGGILGGITETANNAGLGDSPIDPALFIGGLIKNTIGFLGILFMVLIIYGGVVWMTAAGNEERVTKAKKLIANATIGLAIVTIAYTLSLFIFGVIIDTFYAPNPGP